MGAIVRGHRRRLGLTQEGLSAASGLAVRTIRAIEAGQRTLARRDTVRQLARVFDLTGENLDRFFRIAIGEPAGAHASARPRPAQLPPDVAGFAGRGEYLSQLDALADRGTECPRTAVVAAIVGPPGVGKTALAVHWAYRVRALFPDGQLYVDLRGSGPDESAVTAGGGLPMILDALGVAAERVPTGLEEQADLYRDRLTDKRVLLVLDDARDADQVRPLLPRSPGCLAVITGRNVAAPPGHPPLRLDPLPADEARDLLVRRLGRQRLAAEPDAVDEIIARCGRAPLALATVAARAACHPTFPLSVLARELGGSDSA